MNDLDGSEHVLLKLVERLENRSKAYGMEISGAKTKIMANNGHYTNDIQTAGNTLETVDSFKYLSVIVSEG